MVSIKGLSKAAVLAQLYNNSKPLGYGILEYDPSPMSEDEAKFLLSKQKYFDYLYGRVIKADLSSDTEFNEFYYDRDNGAGAAQRAVDALRKTSWEKIYEK